MKEVNLIMFIAACLCCTLSSQPVLADAHHSDMGYTITVPDGWIILDKENVRNKPEVIDAAMEVAGKKQGFSAMPEKLYSKVKELLVGGNIEYYYSPDPQFSISVYEGPGELPVSKFKHDEMCMLLGDKLSKQVARDVNVYNCQNRMVDGHRAFYLVADDYWEGRKYIQYMIRKDDDEILLFTANSRTKNFDDMKREFGYVMTSLTID